MRFLNSRYANTYTQTPTRSMDRSTFIQKTYQFFAASMLSGAAGAYAGMSMIGFIQQYFIGLVILEFVLLFAVMFTKKMAGLNMMLLFAFTFVSGLTLVPLLSMALAMSGGAGIIANAFATTSAIFAALSVYAMKTKTDFSSWGKPLLIAMVVIIISSLVNAFVFHSPLVHIAINAVFLLVLSGMVLFDTQNIIRGAYETPVQGAIALYLDFLNMFIIILQFFMGSRD